MSRRILRTRPATISVPQISNSLGLLERVNAPILGIGLAQLDARKAQKYGDYGYGGHYEPYASKV
jgi:hypothetical protein